ncbi:MAG: beta-lactamase family protein [Thermoguttaceae bacterium]|jgi:N-acyl-D-amino-acid deacylase|nr:beta-lactamase family protein [Thermoguttaceae bacterium]
MHEPFSRRVLLKTLSSCGIWAFTAGRTRAAEPNRDVPVAPTGRADPALASFDRLMASFVERTRSPGAALAVTRGGRLVYARGFGLADRACRRPVQPTDRFRIASISKPITAVAVLQLVERGRLRLETRVREFLRLPEPADRRWNDVTVLHLLRHTGGWDRDRSFDPMFRSIEIAKARKTAPPAGPHEIIRYMLDQPMDFDPGTRYAYSNFGYCLLGRVIEQASGQGYEEYVQANVLRLLGIGRMRLGKTLAELRAPDEVTYYDARGHKAPAVVGKIGRETPVPYGAFYLEAMDAHGGWIASAVDLVRFASAFDVPQACKVLSPASIETMFARPEGPAGFESDGTPKAAYYACGWMVRPGAAGRAPNTWHTGGLSGTSTLLVRRHDGLNWAVLFNTDRGPDGKRLAGVIDPLVHRAADEVRSWPDIDLFAGASP